MLTSLEYTTTIHQFEKKGEKTGWSYIEITSLQANKINPGCKVSFRVKGNIDDYVFEKVALLPMGDGSFILPMNSRIRKAIRKEKGQRVKIKLQVDRREILLSSDLMECLADDPSALAFFKTLPKSHQQYFSNWIEGAKTSITKTKRIVMAITGLSKGQGFGEMIRANKNN